MIEKTFNIERYHSLLEGKAMNAKPEMIGEDLSLIDLYDLSLELRTGSYVLHEEELTIIETSASPSFPYLISGLEKLQIDLEEVRNIIVTHIHLDHAGGTGLFLEKCPNARVFVHPKGIRHLENPSRLIEGAKAVYGNKFQELFEPIIPIQEDRLIAMNDMDTMRIGPNRMLTFMDTPGHAKHHFSIYDSKTNGVFVGDTMGVYYPQLDVELYLPSTSPNQFDPDAMLASAEKIMAYEPDAIYFGHYGRTSNRDEVMAQLKGWLSDFLRITNDLMQKKEAPITELLSKALLAHVASKLSIKGVPSDHPIYDYIKVDLQVCALGLIDYLKRKSVRTT